MLKSLLMKDREEKKKNSESLETGVLRILNLLTRELVLVYS